MQSVLKDFVTANNIDGVSDLDIKAISAIDIGLEDKSNNIITEVADIVGEYSKSALGVSLDNSSSDYGNKLAAAYQIMKEDVTNRLLRKKE